MFLESLVALFLGIVVGTFTGLIPGIHINLISVILLSILPKFSNISPIIFVIFIVSMAITHTFLDFIPSIYLGVPEEDTILSILPGHQMLKNGQAHEAAILTFYGSLTALIIILIFTPIFVHLLPLVFPIIKSIFPFILILISTYSILRENSPIHALIIFLISGFLGFASLNLPIKQPLLPLLTGLFGASSIIISLKNKTLIPKQKIPKLKEIKLKKSESIKSTFGAIISAPLCSFLPGIGAGHASFIGSEIIKQSKKSFLFLLGSINTIVVGLSFITVYIINKTRTGVALSIKEILQTITTQDLISIIITMIFSGFFSFIIAIKFSKIFALNIDKINYQKLSITILLLLTTITITFSGFLGLTLIITSTALGIFTILSKIKRIHLMGSLIFPTILFYLFN